MSATTDVIYFDNAATTWPKPPEVTEAISRFLTSEAANPGRGGHKMAKACSGVLATLRRRLAEMLNAEAPERIILTFNSTDAMNTAIRGVIESHELLRPEITPHIVSTVIEHNAVRRPLNHLEREGRIDLTLVGCDDEGFVDPQEVLDATTDRTVLVTVVHASNVIGAIQPIGEIGALLRANRPNCLFLTDAAQTAGAAPIDVQAMCVDMLSFTGHKCLLGPTGTGGLYIGPRAYEEKDPIPRVVSLRQGGTGADSNSPVNPRELPIYFEAGTPNTVGLCGLLAAIENIPENVLEREQEHVGRIMNALREMPGVTIFGPKDPSRRTGAISMTIAGYAPGEIAAILDGSFNIASRAGLHCAPGAHEAIGTHPEGTIRVSPGPYTTDAEVDALIEAMRQITSATPTDVGVKTTDASSPHCV